jgi:hypothetical protein
MGSTAWNAEQILGQVVQDRRFPEDLFVGSEETRAALREMMTPQRQE